MGVYSVLIILAPGYYLCGRHSNWLRGRILFSIDIRFHSLHLQYSAAIYKQCKVFLHLFVYMLVYLSIILIHKHVLV